MKQKTNRLHFSTRTLAMVLSIVMLIGSIATGSMLNTFAAYMKDAAANSDAVSQAATEGSDIALNAIPSDEDSADDDEDAKEAPDLSRLRENSIVKRLKQDLTATGAHADLAMTGTTYYYHYGTGNSYWSSNGVAMTQSGTTWYADIEFTTQYNNYVRINTTSNSINTSNTTSVSSSFTNNYTSVVNTIAYNNNVDSGYPGYKIELKSAPSTSTTVRVSFDTSDMTTLIVSDPTGSGSGGSGSDGETTATTASKGTIPARVLAGTDIMFYICGYSGTNGLTNATKGTPTSDASSKDDLTSGKVFYSKDQVSNQSGDAYVQITKSHLSTSGSGKYYRISNNLGNWEGKENADLKNLNVGGGNYWANDATGSGAATSCTTTISNSSSVVQGETVDFKTTCGSTNLAYDKDGDLYYQYYIDSSTTPVAVDTNKDAIKGSTSEQTFTLPSSVTSSLSAGTHTITTVVTNGHIWYISETDTLTVLAPETKHAVTTSVSPSGCGSISLASGTKVGEETAISISATPAEGYQFSSWTFGTGVTGASTIANPTTITTESTGDYTVQANFTKKSYIVSYGSASNGSFTVTKAAEAVASGTSLPYQTGLTVTCTPDTGYEVDYVKVNNSVAGVSFDPTTNKASFIVPAANAEITVAFKKSDLSISKSTSPAGKGTITVSKTSGGSNTTTYQVGDTLYLSTSVSDNAYTVSSYTLTYGDGTKATISGATGNTGAIDATHFGTDGSISIIANLTKKPTYKVTVKTSSVAYGSASANVSEAYQGQSVTITATENTGTFNKWTVTSGTVSSVNNSTTNPLTFTMGSTDLVITANFDEYSAQSSFYYNNYGSNGQPAATHYGGRMTEAKLNGETYSYYHVTGRSETDQLFTVSYGDPANNGTVYFVTPDGWSDKHGWDATTIDAQFYGSDGELIQTWSNMTTDGNYGSDRCFKISIPKAARKVQFRAEKNDPDTSNWPATALFDLNDLAEHVDCIYISEYHKNDDGQFDKLGAKNRGNTSKPIADGFFENYNGTNKYTNNFSSGGFNNHNATRGASHAYTKPNNMSESQRGDYYILVLYKNKTYTINGVTKKITNDPEIIWLPKLPSAINDDTPKVDIYAKNGMLRDNTFNRFTNLANTDIDDTYFEYTETLDSGVYTYTSIDEYNDSGLHTQIELTNDYSAYNSTYAKMTNVPVGAKIKLKTTLSDDATDAGSFTDNNGDAQAFKDSHYLKAYTFNGATYAVHEPNTDGVYEETWTVRDVNTKKTSGGTTTNLTLDGKSVEVTPIYYLKDTTNVKTFYIDGYDETVQSKWGNLLSVYPYYEGKSNSANAFGGYPGQPMLFWGGKYQMQIPLTDNGTASGASVKGLTLHNAYWDLLHRDLDIQCVTSSHCQTYDYDDFYKLNKEKNPDTIIFDFKYRTTKDNYGDGYDYYDYEFAEDESTATAATYAGSGYNGVELVTDYFGRQVDVFGTVIKDDDRSDWSTTNVQDKELLIVSTGYKDTYVGEYATMWAVYAPSSSIPAGSGDSANTLIGYISPSMLYLNKIDRVSQYTGGTQTSLGRMSWPEFIDTYNHLKTYYTGVPALISYEEEIWNDSKDKANRSDGKWYYSNKDDQISANIQVQYCDNDLDVVTKEDKALNDAVWTTDNFTGAGLSGETNVAGHSQCSAYFTNTTPYLKGKTSSGTQFADSDKKFTFEAVPSGQYMFVNWVRYSNGKYYEVSEKEVAESPMSSNDTYIARFVKTTSGTLKISHVVETNTSYTGTGTPSVTVTVTNGSTVVFSATSDDGTPIDISRFMHSKYATYLIDISLSTTPGEDCTLHDITNGSGITMYNPGTLSNNAATVTQFTVADALEGDNAVSTLRYVSHLSTIPYTYNYNITYSYTSRFWGVQSYTVNGTLSSTSDADMTAITGSKGTANLTTEFLYNHTPYEKNFRQKIAWNHAGENQTVTGSGTTYTITATVGSTNPVDDRVTAEFMLPYKYNTKANGYKAVQTDQYASTDVDAVKTGTDYVFDDKSYESVSVSTQAYKLFTYDGSDATGGSSTHATNMPLIEAAPYVYKSVDGNPVQMHQNKTYKKRYLNAGVVTEGGKNYYYFTYNSKRYFYKELPTSHLETDVALTASDQYSFYRTKDDGTNEAYTYGYALDPTTGGGTTYNDNEDNNEPRDAIYYWDFGTGEKGQYCVTHEQYKNDGVVQGTGAKRYFTRWDIYTSAGNYVASSYLRFFNYSGYENYTVIPVYESETAAVDESTEATLKNVPTINFLGDTRNQWNNGGGGNYSASARQGDKLMTDFAISFDYYDDEIAKIKNRTDDSSNGKDIRIGMMIEQMGELDSAGGKMITDPSYYADKYKDSITAEKISQIQTYLGNNQNPKTITGANAVVNIKIAANVSSWGRLFTDTTGNIGNNHNELAPIDNYNRLQWYYTFNNISTSTGNPTTDKNFVYRASAYIIEIDSRGNKTVTMSTTPAYFTLYDLANRQLGELD